MGLCLDLTLRKTGHHLDQVMRHLWQHCKAGPMNENDVLNALKALTGRSWHREIKAWVHGTAELPLRELLLRKASTSSKKSARWRNNWVCGYKKTMRCKFKLCSTAALLKWQGSLRG